MNEESQDPRIDPELEARIAALVLGEASDFERDELERLLQQRPELAEFKTHIERMDGLLRQVGSGEMPSVQEATWKLPVEKREAVLAVIEGRAPQRTKVGAAKILSRAWLVETRMTRNPVSVVAVLLACLGGVVFFSTVARQRVYLSRAATSVAKNAEAERQWGFQDELGDSKALAARIAAATNVPLADSYMDFHDYRPKVVAAEGAIRQEDQQLPSNYAKQVDLSLESIRDNLKVAALDAERLPQTAATSDRYGGEWFEGRSFADDFAIADESQNMNVEQSLGEQGQVQRQEGQLRSRFRSGHGGAPRTSAVEESEVVRLRQDAELRQELANHHLSDSMDVLAGQVVELSSPSDAEWDARESIQPRWVTPRQTVELSDAPVSNLAIEVPSLPTAEPTDAGISESDQQAFGAPSPEVVSSGATTDRRYNRVSVRPEFVNGVEYPKRAGESDPEGLGEANRGGFGGATFGSNHFGRGGEMSRPSPSPEAIGAGGRAMEYGLSSGADKGFAGLSEREESRSSVTAVESGDSTVQFGDLYGERYESQPDVSLGLNKGLDRGPQQSVEEFFRGIGPSQNKTDYDVSPAEAPTNGMPNTWEDNSNDSHLYFDTNQGYSRRSEPSASSGKQLRSPASPAGAPDPQVSGWRYVPQQSPPTTAAANEAKAENLKSLELYERGESISVEASPQDNGRDRFDEEAMTPQGLPRNEPQFALQTPWRRLSGKDVESATKSLEALSQLHETAGKPLFGNEALSLDVTDAQSTTSFSVAPTEAIADPSAQKWSTVTKLKKTSRRTRLMPRLPASAGLNEKNATEEAYSTFSLHVSDVSFKLAMAALSKGEWPEADKIRIEEFVNAFDYGDPLPTQNEKVACRIEQSIHPFLQQRNMLRVAMRTAATGRASTTPLRLTFLLDNSGSMERLDRQQTVRRAFALLTQQLQPSDQVTLITFARQPRLVADKISGRQASRLVGLVERLPSEGGTNIEAALRLAYEKAKEQSGDGIQNRVILLTDGAVNLGNANPESLSRIVTTMRDRGIAFDAAGISADGLNDEVLEALTRKGDGRYYLLDSAEAADDGFVRQIAGALRPSAKNVKVQVVFNPQRVGRYQLLGFEKHRLNQEDFRNDQVDAAEMAAAEAGVALYQFEAKPDGEGDVGTVFVRFRDLTTGQMVEKSWPIPYESNTLRVDVAAPSLRIATSAAMLAAKLRGQALGQSVDLKALSDLLTALPEQDRENSRVRQLRQMIQRAREISGTN